MKKIITSALFLIGFLFVISSCSNNETYADKLKDQKKAIERIKRDSSFVFVTHYPENKVFEKNVFYRDPVSGAYFNVVDSGNGKRAVIGETTVLLRFKETYLLASDRDFAYEYSNTKTTSESLDPISFSYRGMDYTYLGDASSSVNYSFLSTALAAPLDYVGQGAIVRFIIPFESGSAWQQYSLYEPIYMGYVYYDYQKK